MYRQRFGLTAFVAALVVGSSFVATAQGPDVRSRDLSASPAVTFLYHDSVPVDVVALHFPVDGRRSVAEMSLEVRNISDRDIVSAKFYLVMTEKGESPAGYRFILDAERLGGSLNVGDKTTVRIPTGENSTALFPTESRDDFVARLVLVYAKFADGSEYFSPFPV
ncbi:MAG: hypothetical protein WBQ66_15345 [Blastocatellia bacterium]